MLSDCVNSRILPRAYENRPRPRLQYVQADLSRGIYGVDVLERGVCAVLVIKRVEIREVPAHSRCEHDTARDLRGCVASTPAVSFA
jgi:hypothetical protein